MNPLETEIEQVRAIADPLLRARAAQKGQLELVTARAILAQIRREAILELRDQGWSYTEIGKALELHRNRVQQIAEGRSR